MLDAGAADPLTQVQTSAIRTILLHVDATAASVLRLELACDLAERLGARVRALFGTAPLVDDASFA